MRDNLILCYHALSPSWDAALSTTAERFAGQLETLASLGYRGTTFTEAAQAPPRSRVVAVTFDDAFRSVFTLARPILEQFGVPGTVFVPTDFIDTGGPLRWSGIDRWIGGSHASELKPMSWDEIRALNRAGWEIGSHTCSHPRLTLLDDAELADEMVRSKAVCEDRLAGPCTAVAYPYGDVDARVVRAAVAAGYRSAAGLPDRIRTRDTTNWPRIGVYRVDDDRRFRIKISPLTAALRGSPAWDALAAARARRMSDPRHRRG